MKLACALLASLLLAPLGTFFAAEAARPNVVFIFADDWGWGDLSSHGHPWLQTPHLDRLAREGTDFHRFNVLNPVCSPSRAAATTGMFPSRFGIHQPCAAPAQNLARNDATKSSTWLKRHPSLSARWDRPRERRRGRAIFIPATFARPRCGSTSKTSRRVSPGARG